VNFAQLLFPDFSLILCGYLLCRFTALNRKVWGAGGGVGVLLPVFRFLLFPFHRAHPRSIWGAALQPRGRPVLALAVLGHCA
jgi:hypothetical protein